MLDELAEQTGGQLYPVANLNDLESISATLGNALRSEYVLGYNSANPSRDGKYHRLKVELVPSSGAATPVISFRRGYYAPIR